MNAIDADAEVEIAEPPAKGGKRWIGISLLLLVVAGGGLAGAWWAGMLTAFKDERAPRPAPTYYFTIDSNLVVNFHGGGRMRYLQVGIEVMTRDPAAIEALKKHAPVVRHHLIMLLSDQNYDELVTADGKRHLQAAALAEVRRLMTERYGDPAVESIYFTSFMMQ